MWFMIIFAIIGFILGLIFGCDIDAALLCIPFALIGLLIGVLVSLFIPVTSTSKAEYYKLISVNHYYVDPTGSWISEENKRGSISAPTIKEKDVVKAPYIKRTITTNGVNNWSFFSKHVSTEDRIQLSLE